MRKHNDECPHECNICNKSFAKYSTLRSHLKIHMDENEVRSKQFCKVHVKLWLILFFFVSGHCVSSSFSIHRFRSWTGSWNWNRDNWRRWLKALRRCTRIFETPWFGWFVSQNTSLELWIRNSLFICLNSISQELVDASQSISSLRLGQCIPSSRQSHRNLVASRCVESTHRGWWVQHTKFAI